MTFLRAIQKPLRLPHRASLDGREGQPSNTTPCAKHRKWHQGDRPVALMPSSSILFLSAPFRQPPEELLWLPSCALKGSTLRHRIPATSRNPPPESLESR
jgi:hypothetical protein